jgi:hypothetical protein
MVKATSAPTLYQQDLVAWYDDTVAKLKAGNFAALDVDALIEEIEGLAGRDGQRPAQRAIAGSWKVELRYCSTTC